MGKYTVREMVGKAPANVVGTPVRRMRGTFVSTGTNTAAGDTIALGRLPIGAIFDHGRTNGTAAAAGVNVSIGSAAAPAKYRALAALGAADTPTGFGVCSAGSAVIGLVREEEVLATLSAPLPAGTFEFDIYFTTAAS